MIISLSEGFGGGLAGAASPFVSCSSAVCCQMLERCVWSQVPGGALASHTLTSHTCMLKWKRSHVDMHTHTHTHTHTLPPLFPPADVLLCGLVTPFIPRSWRVHVSHFWLQSLGHWSAFKLKLTSRSDTPPKSQSWPCLLTTSLANCFHVWQTH